MSLVYEGSSVNRKSVKFNHSSPILVLDKDALNIIGSDELYSEGVFLYKTDDICLSRPKKVLKHPIAIDVCIKKFDPPGYLGSAVIKYDKENDVFLITAPESIDGISMVKVNGMRVYPYQWVKLEDGDEVIIGCSRYRFKRR